MTKTKPNNLEGRCRMAVDAILNLQRFNKGMESTLKDIEMELTHIIEVGKYRFFSEGKYNNKQGYCYDGYGKGM